MKKIPNLFKRCYEGNRQVIDEVMEGSEWVQADVGIATIKFDGTACAMIDGKLYKRYDLKFGRRIPGNIIPCEPERNDDTGHWPHWKLCDRSMSSDKWHFDAFDHYDNLVDGTYELIGKSINGNPYDFANNILVKHGRSKINVPTDFDGLCNYFADSKYEGIVWHHPDGRMVKIKRRDFGYKWPI